MRAPPPQKTETGDEVAVGVNPSFRSSTNQIHDDEEDSDEWMVDTMGSDREFTMAELNKNDRWYKLMSGERKHRKDVDQFVKDHFFNSDANEMDRFLDKMTFVFTVCACMFLTYTVASEYGRRMLPWYYCISYPVLFFMRLKAYRAIKSGLFLLDWCYACSWACLVYLIAFPTSSAYFTILFAMTHSTLPWTVVAYRNSLVFHSLDRFISVYIHVFPMAVFYTLRWFPEDCSKWWWATFETNGDADIGDMFGTSPEWYVVALYMTFGTLLFFTIQQSLEMFFLNYAIHKRRAWTKYADPSYQTLFRYSANKGKGGIYHMLNAFGPRWRTTMWLVLNMLFTLVGAIPVYVWYRYQAANALFAVFVFVMAVWNGANFYIEVFSRKYKSKRPDKPKSDVATTEAASATV